MPKRRAPLPVVTSLLDTPKALITAELRRRQALGQIPQTETPVRMPLNQYIAGAWRYVDPIPFQSNWHIDAMSEHLSVDLLGPLRDGPEDVPLSVREVLGDRAL